MIINENLAYIKNFELTAINDRNRYRRIELPIYLVAGRKYTISARVKQDPNGSGVITLRTYDETMTNIKDEKHCKIDDDGRVFLTFIYDEVSTFYFLFYTDRAKETTGIGASFDYVKLEKGEQMTPFLPHKENLPKDNQPLLPPEGNYKEITPL